MELRHSNWQEHHTLAQYRTSRRAFIGKQHLSVPDVTCVRTGHRTRRTVGGSCPTSVPDAKQKRRTLGEMRLRASTGHWTAKMTHQLMRCGELNTPTLNPEQLTRRYVSTARAAHFP
eukprot:2852499-Rhodomonas_salina.3